MATIVVGFGRRYTAAKQTEVDAAGYGDVVAAGQLTFRGGVDLETIVDASPGLVESVDVSRFTLRDRRFDMITGKPIVEFGQGRMVIEPRKVADCTVTLRRDDTREEVSLPGSIFAPVIP